MIGYSKYEIAQHILTYLNKNKTYKITHKPESGYNKKECIVIEEVC